MSYRSFKRVLGETNLERKCLVLFAACLFLLITGAFWYAERNAEWLVADKTHAMGENFVNFSILRYHTPQHDLGLAKNPYADNLKEMDRDLSTQNYEWAILVPDGDTTIEKDSNVTRSPNGRERAVMIDLQRQLNEQIRSLPPLPDEDRPGDTRPLKNADVPAANSDSSDDLAGDVTSNTAPPTERAETAVADPDAPNDPAEVDSPTPLRSMKMPEAAVAERNSADDPAGEESTTRLQPVDAAETGGAKSPSLTPVSYLELRKDEYHYYQAVYWKENCVYCHTAHGTHFLPTQSESRMELRGPLRVVKVTIPTHEAQLAITKSRAILLATAIITVFLAVITLYLVVRYVVVKPLNHLRYVSDEISRGNTTLRADIQTNDEFEDLAASFNRMLRHLIDTQEELMKVNTDLDGKLDQLAQANMQLHEMNRLKSDFLANMSHELRTPLNSIIGFSDVLKGIAALNDKQHRYVDNIGKSGRILLEMINDILDLAKMESGKMDVRLTEFLIEPVVHAQCDLVRALSEEKNIDLVVQVESGLPPLYQDQGKVQQILTNLLSNAIKFTPEGGRIVVLAKRDRGEELRLTVEDTGVGIAEEDRQIIFEKFRQGTSLLGNDNLTREFSGTGLGLSIVKELCRLLGGEIYFESELGKGSTFTARLPWRRQELPQMQSSLSARLGDVTKSQRAGLFREASSTDDIDKQSAMDRVAPTS
jgi:two-component system sensor histidine kinase BarA